MHNTKAKTPDFLKIWNQNHLVQGQNAHSVPEGYYSPEAWLVTLQSVTLQRDQLTAGPDISIQFAACVFVIPIMGLGIRNHINTQALSGIRIK